MTSWKQPTHGFFCNAAADHTSSDSFQQSTSNGLTCTTINGRTTCTDANGKTVPGVPVSSLKGSPNCVTIVNGKAYVCGPPGPPAPPVNFPPCFPFCGSADYAEDSGANGG